MDPSDRPDAGESPGGEGATSLAGQELLLRLSTLRTRLEAAATDDPTRWRQAGEVIRQSEERLRALDHMLAWAREREATLTARLASLEMRTAGLESRAREVDAIAEKLSQAQLARSEAEADTAVAHGMLASTQSDLEAARAELGQLRSRVGELESDVANLTSELATATLAASRVERLERQRDVALERAHLEARTLLDERIRVAEAERQVIELRNLLAATDAAEFEAEIDEPSSAEEPPGSAAADSTTAADMPASGFDALVEDRDEPLASAEPVIDLTEEGNWVEVDDEADDDADPYDPDDVVVWGPAERGGFAAWLRRGLRGEEPDRE